jgi:hypothetical protein
LDECGEKLHVVRKTNRLEIFKGVIKLIFEVQVYDRMVDKMRSDAWKVMYNRNAMLRQVFSGPNARQHQDLVMKMKSAQVQLN